MLPLGTIYTKVKLNCTSMPKLPVKPRELPAEGSHLAMCIGFYDVGTQTPSNPEWDPARKCYTVFELLGTKNSQGKPFQVSFFNTYSADSRSNFVKMFAPWLGVKKGSDMDTDDMLNRPAQVTIQHDEKGEYANIVAVSPVLKGTKVPKASQLAQALYLDAKLFDEDVFKDLPAKWKEKIEASPEYQEMMRTKPATKGKSTKAATTANKDDKKKKK